MTSNHLIPWRTPKETTNQFSIARRFTFSYSKPFRRMLSSFFGTTKKTSQQRSRKRQRIERSPSPDDPAVWSASDEEWEEATLIPHRRSQDWNNLVRPLVRKLKSHDDQLQAYEDQVLALKLQISELEERSDLLNSQLETSKNHTFALQGAIRDAVPPSVIADTYKDLLESVSSWVSDRVEVLEDDPAHRQSALNYSASRKASTATLRGWIRNGPDLQRTSGVLGSDEDIITSLIWCNLMWTIFIPVGPVYTNEHANRLRIVSELERQMSANSKSPQDLYTISVWKARATDAIVNDYAIEPARTIYINDLAERLASSFRIIQNTEERSDFNQFVLSIKKHIVEPAVTLQELMLCERSQYSLTFEHFFPEHESSESANSAFFTSLDSLDCVVLKPNMRQRLDPAKHLAGVELPKIHERLTKLCTITPALTTRHISDQDGLGPTEILVKQSVLVLLDPVDDIEGPGRSFLDELTFPRYWRGMSRG